MSEIIKYPINAKASLLLEYANKVLTKPIDEDSSFHRTISPWFVEIGCIRSPQYDPDDGYSTLFLAEHCQIDQYFNCKPIFLSFDIEQNAVDIANDVLVKHHLLPMVRLKDGLSAIKDISKNNEIDFLFLDSHKNPSFSFDQYKAARMAPGSILIIDDAQRIEDWQFGKATYVKQVFDKKNIEYKIINTVPGWASLVAILHDGKEAGLV